jgi:hypothetical protein
MASTLGNGITAVMTRWASLTPPDEPSRTYWLADVANVPDGGAGHRAVWFEIPSGGQIQAFGSQVSTVDHEVRAHVRIAAAGVAMDVAPGWFAAHAVQLLNSANRIASGSLGTGIRLIRATRYEVVALAQANPETGEAEANGDFEIIIPLQIRAEEADG